jgi:hypothetical protein
MRSTSLQYSMLLYFVESAKGKAKNVEVNMEELVGNTDGFADSG